MFDRLRRALRNMVPLFSVQIFLTALNLTINWMSGATFFWAIFPILAMTIPELITIGRAVLGWDGDAAPRTSDAQKPAAAKAKTVEHRFADQVRGYEEELQHRGVLIESQVRSDRMHLLAKQFGDWADKVERMEEQVHLLRSDALRQKDLRTTIESLRALEERIAQERDANVRRSLEQTVAARRVQLDALEKLAATTRHAEAQLEATVASLGAIYTQALTNLGTNNTADYRHLAAEVDERVRVLQDELSAIEEVRMYDQRAR